MEERVQGIVMLLARCLLGVHEPEAPLQNMHKCNEYEGLNSVGVLDQAWK